MRGSKYLEAGAPTHCQREGCGKRFELFCIKGENDRYYCSEVCAQLGVEIDFKKVSQLQRAR